MNASVCCWLPASWGALVVCLATSSPIRAQECDHRELAIPDQATWDCMTPLTQTVLFFVPGPSPDSDPPAPGPVDLPCFDFVLYVQIVSNRLEHLGNLTESGYECLENMTVDDFNRYQREDVLYKGILLPS